MPVNSAQCDQTRLGSKMQVEYGFEIKVNWALQGISLQLWSGAQPEVVPSKNSKMNDFCFIFVMLVKKEM